MMGEFGKHLKELIMKHHRIFSADLHLGLMLNLDWFQPFDGTSHSTEVLYAAICNLPRDIRFKRENLLIISILPGPNEVSLHKINHYLAPMVDELEWDDSKSNIRISRRKANSRSTDTRFVRYTCS